MDNLEGRNEIRFNNVGGKCLLENWVEERATQHLEATNINVDEVSGALIHKNGHKGLLTLNNLDRANSTNCESQSMNVKMSNVTTVRSSYKPPTFPKVAMQGKRFKNFLEQARNDVKSDLLEEVGGRFGPAHYRAPEKESIKVIHFDQPAKNHMKTSSPPTPKITHDLYNECPTTFWGEQIREEP